MLVPAFSEQELCNSLDAMRHVPLGTQLPQPNTFEGRLLLEELLALPSSIDPIDWLQSERGDLVARLTLYSVLLFIMKLALGGYRNWINGVEIGHLTRMWVGNLVFLPEDSYPYDALKEPFGTSPKVLGSVLEQLRNVRGSSCQLPPIRDEQQQLYADLLCLSPGVDPLAWLQMERRAIAARTAFEYVLSESLPEASFDVGSPVKVIQPTGLLQTRQLQIAVQEIVLGSTGFTLTATMHVAIPSLPKCEPIMSQGLPRWHGFERATDERGHSYLIRDTEIYLGTSRPSLDPLPKVFEACVFEELRMAFYPAVAVDAMELIFTSSFPHLALSGRRSSQGDSPLTEHLVDPVTWRVAIK